MKTGWQTKKLGDVLQKTETVNPVKRPHDEIDYIDVSSVSSDDLQIMTTQRILGQNAPSRARKRVRVNDVIFATIRPTLRRIAVVPKQLDGQVCSTGFFVLRTKPELDHRFGFYFLQAEEFMGQMESLQKGASYPAVTDGDVKAQVIPIPPLSEQERIVGILDEAFAGIATAKANTEKNLQNGRALFESHLQSVFTHPGPGWVEKRLGTLCELVSGQHIDASDYNLQERGVGYLTGPSDFGCVNPIVSKWTEHPKRMAKQGDILVTVKGAGVGKINRLHVDTVAISRQIMAVRATAADASYLYAFLSTNLGYFQSIAKGAAIPGISREDVLDLVCPMPPPAEQVAIVALICEVEKNTQRLESIYQQKLDALDELKKSLLHDAFRGAL